MVDRRLLPSIAAMAAIVVASNILVQYPFEPFGLADILTLGCVHLSLRLSRHGSVEPLVRACEDADRRLRRVSRWRFCCRSCCPIPGSRWRAERPSSRAAAGRHDLQSPARRILVACAVGLVVGGVGPRHAGVLLHRLCRNRIALDDLGPSAISPSRCWSPCSRCCPMPG